MQDLDTELYLEALDQERERHPELASFIDDGWIAEVLHVVKSGKEATVLCCKAGSRVESRCVAAKIYRSRNNRVFRNDAIYQEGRVVLDRRARRAYEKKSRAGRQVQEGGWIYHEWDTLKLLHAAGADVPAPFAQAGNVLLMEYVGEPDDPATPLYKVSLQAGEAHELFHTVMRNIKLYLAHDRIHSDLSAYNILYWEGRLKIIDFPQAVDPRSNPNALALLQRDVENVCAYFAKWGVQSDPHRITRGLWGRFLRGAL